MKMHFTSMYIDENGEFYSYPFCIEIIDDDQFDQFRAYHMAISECTSYMLRLYERDHVKTDLIRLSGISDETQLWIDMNMKGGSE